jgi:hypothetical protein
MAQEITVIVILAAVIIYVGFITYNSLKGRRKSPCDDCDGCALKEQLKGTKINCKDRKDRCN